MPGETPGIYEPRKATTPSSLAVYPNERSIRKCVSDLGSVVVQLLVANWV